MLEALWTVRFLSNQDYFGSGVAVFETGRVFGGDSQYYWTGTYELDGGVVSGRLAVKHYSGPQTSVFGPLGDFQLNVSGTVDRNKFVLDGSVVGSPEYKVGIELTRRAELP